MAYVTKSSEVKIYCTKGEFSRRMWELGMRRYCKPLHVLSVRERDERGDCYRTVVRYSDDESGRKEEFLKSMPHISILQSRAEAAAGT